MNPQDWDILAIVATRGTQTAPPFPLRLPLRFPTRKGGAYRGYADGGGFPVAFAVA